MELNIQRKVIFAEIRSFVYDRNTIIESLGEECFDLYIDAICPLSAFETELSKNKFFTDYFTKEFLQREEFFGSAKYTKLATQRLINLFNKTFIRNKANYAVVVGPPKSHDKIFPLIISLNGSFNFVPIATEISHLKKVAVRLDFKHAFSQEFGELDILKN